VIRVFVVAESAVARAGLEALLRSSDAVEIAGSSADPLAAAEMQPDVVVFDWSAGDDFPPPETAAPAVILASGHDAEWTRDTLRLGARAVLARDASREEILGAVEAVAAGLVALEPRDVAALVGGTARALPQSPVEPLTPREIEVLGMLAEGEGNKAIAWKLGISEHTVKFHVASILAKLHASSRTEAVTIGVRRGLILL
jgi:two-component system, NarL family, response regulator YdfI